MDVSIGNLSRSELAAYECTKGLHPSMSAAAREHGISREAIRYCLPRFGVTPTDIWQKTPPEKPAPRKRGRQISKQMLAAIEELKNSGINSNAREVATRHGIHPCHLLTMAYKQGVPGRRKQVDIIAAEAVDFWERQICGKSTEKSVLFTKISEKFGISQVRFVREVKKRGLPCAEELSEIRSVQMLEFVKNYKNQQNNG